MVLIDTPVWSLALRRKTSDLALSEIRFRELLYRLISHGRAQLIGSVRQELLSGLREEAQFRRLRDFLRDFPDTPVETRDYEDAARASNACRRAGITGSAVDMLICAIALDRDWPIFTTDRDFANYQRVIKIQLLVRPVDRWIT